MAKNNSKNSPGLPGRGLNSQQSDHTYFIQKHKNQTYRAFQACDTCYQEKNCDYNTICENQCNHVCPNGTIFCDKFKISEDNFKRLGKINKIENGFHDYQPTNLNFSKALDPENVCKAQAVEITSFKNYNSIAYKKGFSFIDRCKLPKIYCNRDRKGYGRFTPSVLLEKWLLLPYSNQTYDFSKIIILIDALIVDNFQNSTKIMGRRKKYKRLPENRTDMKKVIQPFTDESQKNSTYPKIPNIFHLIWFSDEREFTLINFSAIISILRFTSAKKIFFHTDVGDILQKNSQYFRWLQCLGGDRFEIVNVRATEHVFLDIERKKWIKFSKIYHQADFYRLLILIQFGGIYIDDDIIQLKDIPEYILNLRGPLFDEFWGAGGLFSQNDQNHLTDSLKNASP